MGTTTERSFRIGEKVERRDKGKEWGTGCVTSAKPLEGTVRDDPKADGYSWDEVGRFKDAGAIP